MYIPFFKHASFNEVPKISMAHSPDVDRIPVGLLKRRLRNSAPPEYMKYENCEANCTERLFPINQF
jgi:hypothetical protein